MEVAEVLKEGLVLVIHVVSDELPILSAGIADPSSTLDSDLSKMIRG